MNIWSACILCGQNGADAHRLHAPYADFRPRPLSSRSRPINLWPTTLRSHSRPTRRKSRPWTERCGNFSRPNRPQESPLNRAIRELGLSPETSAAAPGAAPLGLVPALTIPAGGGGAQLKLIDISLDGLFAAGTSTADEQELQQLEGGGHDQRKRGFTGGVELSMMGAVDPYFDGEMHLVNFTDPIEGDTVVELEEAFMTTRSLPKGLQSRWGSS